MGRLRIGVVGLGRDWEARYRPALAALGDRIEVAAVYDQVARRAEIVARQLRCRTAEGLVDLVDDPEVDAVALLAPQWFGTHAIELAARAGKPIYAAIPLPDDEAGLARLEAIGRDHPPRLMAEGVGPIEQRPDGPPPAEARLDQFDRMVRGLDHHGPTWDDALAAARASAATRLAPASGPEGSRALP